MAFTQGRPDGTPTHPHPVYPVHLLDSRTATVIRDNQLGNKFARAICCNGGYHMWLTKNINEVTCEKCKKRD